jgi:peptidoglycan/LPS O-acetylase OafA/YrhL
MTAFSVSLTWPLQLGVIFVAMHKRFAIVSAVFAAAMLGFAFAGWMAGPGETRAELGTLAVVSGFGLGVVWLVAMAGFDLSGRDEWIVCCVFASALALALGVFKSGPTAATFLLSLAIGPVLATAAMIRQMSWGQWPGWSMPPRKLRTRKSRAQGHHQLAKRAARANVAKAIELVKSSGRGNAPTPGDELTDADAAD